MSDVQVQPPAARSSNAQKCTAHARTPAVNWTRRHMFNDIDAARRLPPNCFVQTSGAALHREVAAKEIG